MIVLFLASPIFASQVKDIELNYNEGFTVAKVAVNGPFRVNHTTAAASADKPYRIVVDIHSATHALNAKDYLELPNCPIQSIRTSQYSTKPEQIVRIVFDMKKTSIYRVENSEGQVNIYFADQNGKAFSTWTAKDEPTHASHDWKKNTQAKSSINDKGISQRLASTPATQDKAKKPVVKSQKPKKQPVVAQKTKSKVTPTDAGFVFGPFVDPIVLKNLTRVEPENKPAPTPLTKPQPVQKQQQLAKVDNKEHVSDNKPEPQRKAVKPVVKQSPAVAVKQSQPKHETQPPVKPAAKIVLPETKKPQPQLVKVQSKEKALATKPVPVQNKTARVESSPLMPSNKPFTFSELVFDKKQKPVLVQKEAPKKPVVVAQVDAKAEKSEADAKNPAKVEEGQSHVKKTRATSRFRRSPITSKKMRGTLVAEFPKRLVVKYTPRLNRDPFETLLNETKTFNNPVETRVPNVEGLKLVGVIESNDKDNRALFEDATGYGYILKTGDRVQKGYVLRVDVDKVYFQIFEYGWSRTVALRMQEY